MRRPAHPPRAPHKYHPRSRHEMRVCWCRLQAYGLTTAMGFSDVTSNEDLAALLSNTYGGDIDLLDAYTGALAEGSISSTSSTSSSSSSGTTSTSTTVNATTTSSSGDVFGELLRVVWVDQMYRSYVGDRLHHLHSRSIEDARLTTMSGLVQRVVNNVTDLPLSAFQVPTSSVASAEEDETQVAGYMTFSDYYAMGWTVGASLSMLRIVDIQAQSNRFIFLSWCTDNFMRVLPRKRAVPLICQDSNEVFLRQDPNVCGG